MPKSKLHFDNKNILNYFQLKIFEVNNQSAPIPTQIYLANLLSRYSRSENFFLIDDQAQNKSLVILLEEALKADGVRKISKYKKIGDDSLFMVGVFHEKILKSGISLGYYSSIGSFAYGNVSALSSKRFYGKKYSSLYNDLSNNFNNLVDITRQVFAN